eukprot:SAG11_NODE_397_length_9785_cov_3.709581_5_plen_275_part_00
MQHHDALTGTGGGACDLEFHTMLSNATKLAEEVIANATAALIAPTEVINLFQSLVYSLSIFQLFVRMSVAQALSVYSVPSIPPTPYGGSGSSVCATHGCTVPPAATCAADSGVVDCAGHGSPPLPGGNSLKDCNDRGCCWSVSSKHSWCYLPMNETLKPATPSANRREWPKDGTVLTLPPDGHSLPIVAANSLAWNRTDVISVRVLSFSSAMAVTDSSGKAVLAQLAPPEPVNASLGDGPGSHVLRHQNWAKWAAGSGSKALVMSRLIIKVALL